jgi:hypothetical protein
MDRRLATMKDAVRRIQARGGRVVLYRPPVSKAILDDEEAHFPVDPWFERAAATLGATGLNFTAVPELRDLECPDGAHLDEREVPRATEAFAVALLPLLGP